MRKKNKKKLIRESIKRQMIWHGFQKKYYNKVIMLERKGYPKDLISEAVYVDATKGFIKAIMGTAEGDGTVEQFRLIVKEQVTEYHLKSIGVDPDSTKAAMLRNGLQEAMTTMTDEEFKQLLKGGEQCNVVAMKIGDILGVAVKDGLKEQLFTGVVNAVFEDFGNLKDNIVFGGLFISMREKFSTALEEPLDSAIDEFFETGEFMEKCAELVCNISLVDMIKQINPNFIEDIKDYIASAPREYLNYIMN